MDDSIVIPERGNHGYSLGVNLTRITSVESRLKCDKHRAMSWRPRFIDNPNETKAERDARREAEHR